MSRTPDQAQPDPTDRTAAASPLSRRALLKQATAVGAAAAAAGLVLDAVAAPAAAAAAPRTPGRDRNPADETLVVRVVDARSGELDFFQGHRHHRVRDVRLTAELIRASR